MFEITVRDGDDKQKRSITYVTNKYMLCIEAEKDTLGIRTGGAFPHKELIELLRVVNDEINNINRQNILNDKLSNSKGSENRNYSAKELIFRTFIRSEGTQDDYERFINGISTLGVAHGPSEL